MSIATVLLVGGKSNKPIEWDKIIELYSHNYTRGPLMVDGCYYRKDAVSYLTVSGL